MPRYKQPAIEVRELDKQLLLFLKAISIPDSLHRWILQRLECNRGEQEVEKAARRTSLEKTYQDTTKSLENLTKLRIRELINDEEFAKER